MDVGMLYKRKFQNDCELMVTNFLSFVPQFAVGVVESLEAREEFATSESFRKNHPAKIANFHGAEGQLPNGRSSSSDFLAGNLKTHLDSLEYGRFCEQSYSPSVQHPYGYPAVYSGSEQQRSWEGPGLPAQLMPFGAFIYPYQHQPRYFPQQFFPQGGTRPKGTGTYFPVSKCTQHKIDACCFFLYELKSYFKCRLLFIDLFVFCTNFSS